MTPAEAAYKLAYEISPIYLTGGIAGNVPGATVPLIAYTEGGLLGGLFNSLFSELGPDTSLDNFFAHFIPLPGSEFVVNALGRYPMANQQVAGNAIIFEPKHVSLMMLCPVRAPGGYLTKMATITALVQTLNAHCQAGGTFTVATPAYLFVDCILLRMIDAGAGETRQFQYRFQLDFEKPLISQAEAQQSYNNLLSKIGAQTQLQAGGDGGLSWGGLDPTVGNQSSGGSLIIPGNQQDQGLGFAPNSFYDRLAGIPANGFDSSSDATSALPPTDAEIDAALSSQVQVPTVIPLD